MDIDANLIIGIITGFFVFFVIERRYRPSMKIELATSWLDKDKGKALDGIKKIVEEIT